MRDVEMDPEAMRVPVLAGAVLIVLALATTAFARLTEIGTVRLQPVTIVASKVLTFVDRPDGAMVAHEADRPGAVHVADAKGDGFVRVAVTSMVRERSMAGVPLGAPFKLLRDAQGLLWLEDQVTGHRISLTAFGPTNARAFSKMLNDDEGTVQ